MSRRQPLSPFAPCLRVSPRSSVGVRARLGVRALVAAVALGAGGACATGCSSPQYEGAVYRGNGLAFRTGAVPRTWQRLDVPGGTLAFRDDQAETTVLLNARCGKDADDVPLAALTGHLFLQFTDREILTQTVVPMDGREAMQTVMKAKLDGVPKSFDVFVLKKDGCVYDFIDIAAPSSFDTTRSAFESFVAGFHTLSG